MASYIPPSVQHTNTSGCTNCFSGCVQTTSDKCVKYTGSSIEFLGIETGDTLVSVEKAITDYLTAVLSGEGISPELEPTDLCDIVNQFLPSDPTLVDILTAIVKTLCLLETEIAAEKARIDVIEDDYTVDCISVAVDAGTHDVLQAVINELCSAVDDITVLQALYATCITTSTINTYIQTYLNAITVDTKMSARMVPYVAYPYFGTDLSSFGPDGVGVGTWENVYLCNGYNGLTPDLRGRILIATTYMAGTTVDPVVAPGGSNPTYILNTKEGANAYALSEANLPAHSHTIANDGDHQHTVSVYIPSGLNMLSDASLDHVYPQPTSVLTTENGDHSHVAATTGSNLPHLNIPPVHACYYVMYLP
jgi:microcystin-dependent protein